MPQPTQRQAWRRTDDYAKGAPKVKLVTEDLPLPLHPTAVLIKVHAVALNYRDANIANGGNPWPVTPNGIPGNDAAGEIVSVGNRVSLVKAGDRIAPITDSKFVNARSTGRSWLAANEDGILATNIAFDEKLRSSPVLEAVRKTRDPSRQLQGSPRMHKEVLRLTNGVGVDLVIENGGSSSLVRSMECTRRGGIVSQVGYLGGPKPENLKEFVSTIIDRRLNVRGINAGSKDDQDELIAAISATQIAFEDILDSTWSFDKADKAIEYVWQGKQVGKVIIKLGD
nr:hypothetical protein FVER53263_12132 [Fusarium verticillioides]